MITIPLKVETDQVGIPLKVSTDQVFLPLAMTVSVTNAPDYDGSYEFTPSDVAQVIHIADHKATNDITINPIPSDYGHIAWNGSIITVY